MNLNRADSSKITPEARQKVLEAYKLSKATPLAVGSEAEVYDYNSESVLKIYADSDRLPHFETLRKFYSILDTSATALSLPKITQITQHGELIATLESRVEGIPLEDKLSQLDESEHELAEKLYLDAVFQLRNIILKETPTTYLLFDETQQSLSAKQSFNSFYGQFLQQKIEHVGQYLEPAYPQFSDKAPQLVKAIQNGTTDQLAIVHGDFFPGNVLVDANLTKVHGVIDFGSFTIIGNYLLDIAGAFGFYRMYEPHRIQIRQKMLPKILERLAEDAHAAFFQYLLAHAILTSDLYAPDPDPTGDGHFHWATEIVSDDSYWQGALG